MSIVTNSATSPLSDGRPFERVPVRDHENREHLFSVSKNIERIGGGIRGEVYRVLEEQHGEMAMKQYPAQRLDEISGDADRAVSGLQTLLRILPPGEHELLVQPLYVDRANQRLFSPLLNKEHWIVGTAKNSSKDRDALKQNKLPDVQNFDQSVTRLFDALEYVGKNGSVLCADVYFFSIKHSNRELGYRYGDYEAIHDVRQRVHPNHIAPTNVLGAAVSLHDFLRECVQNPETYLRSLYTEANRRLNAYKEVDPHIAETIAILEEKAWPEPTMREMLKGALPGLREWLKERWRKIGRE